MATNRITELETKVCKLLLGGRLDSEGRMKFGGWDDFCKEAFFTLPDLTRYSNRALAERLIKDGLVNRHHGKKPVKPEEVTAAPDDRTMGEVMAGMEFPGNNNAGCVEETVYPNGTTLSDIAKRLDNIQDSLDRVCYLLGVTTELLRMPQEASSNDSGSGLQQETISFPEG